MKLVLAEKPSVAQSIAKVLGANKREDGYLEGNGYVVSWCVGHLVELAQPEAYDAKYSKWTYADLPIFPSDWRYEVSAGTKKQFGILKKLMARDDVASLVCATDAGREGELIFRLVYHKAGCRKPFERLWISSMEDSAIREGFENLRSGTEYDALYEAALCRERADWIVGINATRLFSTLYGQTLNVGRVMTPTLAMAVMREAAIAAFKPEPFYTVHIGLDGFTAASERFKKKSEAEAVSKDCSIAAVKKAERKEKSEKPPALYDLTSLQRDANRLLGYTAQQTLDYTQNLYEKKLVTYADFLNKRQRLVLLYLIEELIDQFDLIASADVDMAKFIIGALSSLIDQVVDWDCRLSMWIPQNEQVGRGFCGPGVAMLFDYAETDQVLDGPANLRDKLKRIVKGVKSFENCKGQITVKHAHAQQLPFESDFFDAIVTDPPYYDNIYYSILADFFYVWKKILLQRIEPELFKKQITDYNYELVASSKRVDEGQSAHEEYCKQLCMAFREAARVLKNDGVFTFVYSHSSVNGWEAVVRAYRQSEFFVSSVQPLSIERKGRPRAVLSQAVNTCVTIVARKSTDEKQPISLEAVLEKTQTYCDDFGKLLIEQSGWTQPDAGLAVIACTVGFLANTSGVNDAASDTDALLAASKIVKKEFPEFTIKVRDSI